MSSRNEGISLNQRAVDYAVKEAVMLGSGSLALTILGPGMKSTGEVMGVPAPSQQHTQRLRAVENKLLSRIRLH